MEKEFVPYDRALRLKALGFDEPCFGFHYINPLNNSYTELKYGMSIFKKTSIEIKKGHVLAPTFSQAFRWFREKYVLLGFIEPANGYEDKSLFAFYICDDEQNIVDDSHSYSKDSSLHFKIYEEAELACLDKLIEYCQKLK